MAMRHRLQWCSINLRDQGQSMRDKHATNTPRGGLFNVGSINDGRVVGRVGSYWPVDSDPNACQPTLALLY